MSETERRASFTEYDLALLHRVHRAIKDNTPQDVIAAIHEDLVIKKDKLCAYIVAFGNALPSNSDTYKGLHAIAPGLNVDGQSTDQGQQNKGEWDLYLEGIAYISIVWSPDVVQYYGWDVDLGYGKVRSLYRCAKAYNDFEDFLAHHNLLQWLRHKQSVLRVANKAKTCSSRGVQFCPGRQDWPSNDLQTLVNLFKRGSMRVYGCKITLSTAKEYRQRMEEWTKDSDGLVEIDGKQIDLKVAMPGNWKVYLLQYDDHGRLEQRQSLDLPGATPQRNGIMSPPASSIAVSKSRLADQDTNAPSPSEPSVSQNTGTSTRSASPESIRRRLTARDLSAPGDHAEDVAQVTLTDDEGSDGGVASNTDAEASETVQQADRTVESDSAYGSENVESQANATHSAVESNPKARPNATVPPYDADASTEGRQEGDPKSGTGDLGDADSDRDDASNHEMRTPNPPRRSLESPDPTLAGPTDGSSDESNGVREDQAQPDERPAADAVLTGGTLIEALPDRSARPSPHERSLFVSGTSEYSYPPSTRERSIAPCPPSPSSTIKNNRRPPPLADNSGQRLRSGQASAATKSTRTTITTLSLASSSTATSVSHSSSEHDAAECDGDDNGQGHGDNNDDAGSTTSQPTRSGEHSTTDGNDTSTEEVRSSNVNLWREEIPPSDNALAEAVDPGERLGFFDLLNKIDQTGEGHPFAYDLPTPQEVIGYGVHRWNRHRGLRLTDCGCDICEDLKPLLNKTTSQVSATGASQLCQARSLWLNEARWASATDLDSCVLPTAADSEVLLASHASFHRMADQGLLFDKPIIARDPQEYEDVYNAKELQRILLDRFEGFPVPVTNVLSCEPRTVAVEDFLAGVWSSEEPVGCSDNLESLEADSPAFVKYPRFCLLRSAVARARVLSESNFNEVFDRTKAFTRVEASGFFCAPRVGTFGGTWLRVLTGELLCMFVPRAQMTTIMYGDFAREDLQWQPRGKQKLFLLQKNDVLALPPGIMCAHVAVGACVSIEGSFWDEREIGRYATATRLTPECNPPRVAAGIPQRATDCVLDGLAAIVKKSEHRYESDLFYRGNGRFGLPSEIAEAALDHDHDDAACRGAKRMCQTPGEDAACGSLDETMNYI